MFWKWNQVLTPGALAALLANNLFATVLTKDQNFLRQWKQLQRQRKRLGADVSTQRLVRFVMDRTKICRKIVMKNKKGVSIIIETPFLICYFIDIII